MITNLVASVVVSLVTNTTERLPMHTVPDPCPDGLIGCLVYHCHLEPDKDPDRKWVKTEVVRQKSISFAVDGVQYRETLTNEVISAVEVEMRLERKEIWNPAKTNVTAWPCITTNGGVFIFKR